MPYWQNELMTFTIRQRELKPIIEEWQLIQLPVPHSQSSYQWWVQYADNGVLPFEGAWMNQPTWLHEDFAYFNILDEWHGLPYKISDAQKQISELMKK